MRAKNAARTPNNPKEILTNRRFALGATLTACLLAACASGPMGDGWVTLIDGDSNTNEPSRGHNNTYC